jgi:hypothetical protein
MTRLDKKILFTALAFVAVAGRETDAASSRPAAAAVTKIADLIEEFCEENAVSCMQPVSDEPGGLLLDEMIERQKRELREREETRLPEDRQSLMKLHDRLEHRKARREAREFYAFANDDRLADAVLRLLDEEIEAERGAAFT